ncbi:MAG: hypothetical protein IPI49_12545 [Myxococcales bacterium]|nr:hypothetical protein [Myxococcales bacterium]
MSTATPRAVEVVALGCADPRAPIGDDVMRSGPERMALRLMSRSAVLAYHAAREALAGAAWPDLTEAGLFMAVGASGSDLEQLRRILLASQGERGFTLARFGEQGLRVCNPLFAFQLMNNFTMAHTAILTGTRGPNAVLFSRGVGTLAALDEALAALRHGDCARALVGAADSAVHPVTALEHTRWHGELADAPAGEGAAVLALAAVDPRAGAPEPGAGPSRWHIASVEWSEGGAPRPGAPSRAALGIADDDAVVLHGWRADVAAELATALAGRAAPAVSVLSLPDCLAATAPLAWAEALSRAPATCHALAVVTADRDGGVGAVRFVRGAR